MKTCELYRQLPHSGAMCLLDQVVAWDAQRICCSTDSHLAAANPLRHDGVLPGLCALEYAAQALALHGVLNRQQRSVSGRYAEAYVVSSKRLVFPAGNLSDVGASLVIKAELIVWHEASAVYTVSISADERSLLQGDLSVMLS